jgi:hypothetical protein
VKGFSEVLAQNGYANPVKGYGGLVHVNKAGGFEVVPERLKALFLEMMDRAGKLYRKEKGELEGELVGLQKDPIGNQSQIRAANGKLVKLERDYSAIIKELNSWFEPGEKQEVFSSVAAWKKHGTPATLDEWIEMSK